MPGDPIPSVLASTVATNGIPMFVDYSPALSLISAQLDRVIALLAEEERTRKVEPEHRCGVQGFDGMNGDVCPHPMCQPAPQADSAGLLDTHNYRNEYNALIQLIAEQTYAVGIGETMTAEDRVRRVCDRIRELDKRVSKEVEAREFWFRKYHNGRSDDDEWRSFSPESRQADASVLRVPAPAGALAGDQQADRRAGGAHGSDTAAGAGDDGGVAEAARSKGLLRSGEAVVQPTAGREPSTVGDGQREATAERLTSPPSGSVATPGAPQEIPEEVVMACVAAYNADQGRPTQRGVMLAALHEYDRQMPALRGRVLDTALCCVSPQGRVIGVYQQRHFAEEAATVCGGTVHRVALVEMVGKP